MLGFITKEKAKQHGFTNHGRYFGIPCWLADEGEGMMVAAKWMPLEYIFSAFMHIEQTIRGMFFPGEDPGFQFDVGREI